MDSVSSISFSVAFTLTQNGRLEVATSFDVNPDPPNFVADFDGNRLVDLQDLITLLATFGRHDVTFTDGDTKADGDADVTDPTRLLNEYGVRCP